MSPAAERPRDPADDVLSTINISRVADEEQRKAGAVARFEQRSRDGWITAGTVSRGSRGLVISHLQVWPQEPSDDPTESVTSRLLRDIPVGKILSVAQTWLDATSEPGLEEYIDYTAVQMEEFRHGTESRPGRAPLTDDLLLQVAEGYLEETAPGKPRGAVKRLAERLGKPEPTVSRWVMRARRDGWLTAATPGREGGGAGWRLLELRAIGKRDAH